jgi:hypothetical protein
MPKLDKSFTDNLLSCFKVHTSDLIYQCHFSPNYNNEIFENLGKSITFMEVFYDTPDLLFTEANIQLCWRTELDENKDDVELLESWCLSYCVEANEKGNVLLEVTSEETICAIFKWIYTKLGLSYRFSEPTDIDDLVDELDPVVSYILRRKTCKNLNFSAFEDRVRINSNTVYIVRTIISNDPVDMQDSYDFIPVLSKVMIASMIKNENLFFQASKRLPYKQDEYNYDGVVHEHK